MEEKSDVDDHAKRIITHLIDSWNVGVKRGSFKNGCDKEVVKKYLRSVGLIVHFMYFPHPENSKTEYIMVKASESDNIPNPLETPSLS
jgi:hypothetical protein